MRSLAGIILDIWPGNIEYFLLMFTRVSALIISSPIFGRKNIPNTAKIAFCLFVSAIFYTTFPPASTQIYSNAVDFILQLFLEFCFGLVLGVVTNMFFTMVFTTGQIADMQIGFGMVNVFDPQSGISAPVTGTLLNLVLLICFFMVDGHLKLINMLFNTFEYVPVGQVTLNPYIGIVALELFANCFKLSISIALPFIGMGLIIETFLGLLIRTMPQMNMFVVGMPMKLIVGFIVFIMVAETFTNYSVQLFEEMFKGLTSMLSTLVP